MNYFKNIVIFLVLFSIFQTILTCGEICTELSYHQCTVCIQDCDAEGYQYGSCKQRYCADYQTEYYYNNNGSRRTRETCVRYDYYNHTQSQCITKCCGDVGIGVSTFANGFFKQCLQENQRLSQQLGIILGCVFGGIALIVGIIIFVIWRKNRS